MTHTLHIHAINSKATKVLDSVFNQWEAFNKTMEGFSNEDEAKYLKEFLIENELIESFNKNLPLIYVPSHDVQVLLTIDRPSHVVFFYMIKRLCKLHVARTFLYTPKENQPPVPIFVWESDYNKISKHMKNRLVRIYD